MKMSRIKIGNIPAIVFGDISNKVYVYVHGKMGKKEEASSFAEIAIDKGFQVISFDLPEHGERMDIDYQNNIWNGVSDLNEVLNYAKSIWKEINLYAVSIGVYYRLIAYSNIPIKNCLFISPIIDMKKLIENMLLWSNSTIEKLTENSIIETSFGETLNIDYYNFVLENPIRNWNNITHILYGMQDNMMDFNTIINFTKKFNCELTTYSDMEHYQYTEKDLERLKKWQEKSIQ